MTGVEVAKRGGIWQGHMWWDMEGVYVMGVWCGAVRGGVVVLWWHWCCGSMGSVMMVWLL